MEILAKENFQEFDQFVDGHKNGYFTQTTMWARVKKGWIQEIVVVRGEDGAIKGGISILVRPIKVTALMYASRGPVCSYEDTETIKELLEGAKLIAKKYNAYLLKFDPFILEEQKELIAGICKLGVSIDLDAGFKDTIQPRHNYMVDLVGKDEESLMATFIGKTRYYIRYPSKNGVECRVVGAERIDDFYSLYEQTGKRQGFSIRSKEYLVSILRELGSHARLYMCYLGEEPLCGGIATQFAKKTAHVYGCSGESHRNLRATNLLQWSMMQWALEGGCTVYDMQGVALKKEDSEALFGVLAFKQNFAGRVVSTAGEFEVVYSKPLKLIAKVAQKLR